MKGSITSVGFASGHRFVVGAWDSSPIGALADVMWARPDGLRVLLAAPAAAEFITSIYVFDTVLEGRVEVRRQGRELRVCSERGDLRLTLTLGRAVAPFPPRPRAVTATIENWCSTRLLGVRTVGTSPTGVKEWYRTRSLRWIADARGALGGEGLGMMSAVARPLGFGFTDSPRRPSHVRLQVDLRRAAP